MRRRRRDKSRRTKGKGLDLKEELGMRARAAGRTRVRDALGSEAIEGSSWIGQQGSVR